MTLNEFLAHFSGVKEAGRGSGKYMALCPGHSDHNQSLSIRLSDDKRRILVRCFAGCSQELLLARVGLRKEDLIIKQKDSARKKVEKQRYKYLDKDGRLLYEKTRVDYDDGTKSFFFEKPDGTKGVQGVKRVTYNLPDVISSPMVYIAEGEKCADAVNAAGRVATTLDRGANSAWLPEFSGYFEGKAVVVIPDNDEPGMEYALSLIHISYSGRFIRPSILAEHTPASFNCPTSWTKERSFKERSWPVPPGAAKGSRQGWAQEPRLPLRPPKRALR